MKIIRLPPLAVTALYPTAIILMFQTMSVSLRLVLVSMKAKKEQKTVRMVRFCEGL